MTLVVGFNFGSLALVAADTRVSWYPDGKLVFRDDRTKVVRTALGLATGAGLLNVLDPVKRRFENTMASTDDILDIIRDEVDSYRRRNSLMEPRVREVIDATAWMFTYVTVENRAPILRLALATTEPGARLMHVLPGTSWMFPPTGATREQLDEWMQRLKEGTRAMEEGADLMQHVAEHADVAADLMRRVSDVNEGVAPTFQLAIHSLPNFVGLSSIIGEDGEHTWNFGQEGEPDRNDQS